MRSRIRIAVALAIAVVVLIVAGVAAATKGAPTTPAKPVAGSPASSAPCSQHDKPGMGLDGAVSSTTCPGNDDPVDLVGHAQTVVPTPGMDNVHPTSWIKAAPSADGTSVTVRFWSGVEPCYVLDHVDVAYGTDAVTITLYQGNDPTAGDVACIDIAMLKQVVVPLDQPLDGRQLVDGSRT